MRKLISLSIIGLMALSAMAENIQTIVYTPSPVMTCQNCEKKIKGSVRFVKGTKRIETSLEDQTVTITYDADKAKPEDYVAAFAKIGREVTEVKGADKADKKASKHIHKADKEAVKGDKQAVKAAVKHDMKAEKQDLKAVKKAVKAERKGEVTEVKAQRAE